MGIINNLNNAMYTMHDNFQAKFNNMVHTGNNANASKQVQDTQTEEKQASAAPADAFVPSAEASADEFTSNAVNSGAAAGMTKGLDPTEEENEASETSEAKTGETKTGTNEEPVSNANESGSEMTDTDADATIDKNRNRADEIKNGQGGGDNGGNGNDNKTGEKKTEGPQMTAAQAQELAAKQKEADQVRTILLQMNEDRRKWLAELIKTIRETNDKIFEIIQSSILNRASVFNSVNKAWSDVIRGR